MRKSASIPISQLAMLFHKILAGHSKVTKYLLFAFVTLSAAGAPRTEIPVFIFAGQSEALCSGTDSGQLSAEMLAPQTNVLLYNARSHDLATSVVHWVTYQPPTGCGYAGDCGHVDPQGSFGPEITAANLISQSLYHGKTVGIYKYAVGSSDLAYWWNPTSPGPLYAQMMTMLEQALATMPSEVGFTGRVAGVFWTQGESDALDGPDTAADYGRNLLAFVTRLRSRMGEPRMLFIYGRILPDWANSASVRQGQESLTNQLPDCCMVNADDLPRLTLHYNNEGTMELGKRYAAGFEYVMKAQKRLSVEFSSGFHLRAYGLPLSAYKLQYSDGLAPSFWHDLITIQTDLLGTSDCEDRGPLSGAPTRFYRLHAF